MTCRTCTATWIFPKVLKRNSMTEHESGACSPLSHTEAGENAGFFCVQTSARRVLGIDPGLASTGFGIVDCIENRCVLAAYGCIETAPGTPRAERLLAIHKRLCAVIEEFRPQAASMETLYFSRNAVSALAVAEARGIAALCTAQYGIPLAEYTPNIIKQSVSGTARAGKQLVQECVKLLLGLETIPSPDHAADALAAAITHIHYHGLQIR